MENYSYTSYPESGDSSPRSREIDFENNAAWEDPNQIPNYKVKFMCSYGGKIHPRPHDNLLAYIGGETKILSVDRNTKFPTLISKLAAICDTDTVSFKYQLPGEDLDALISVTNDDDLEHMMHEYDRLYRASPKPARLRLFLFPANPPATVGTGVSQSRSFCSEDSKSEKDRFVDALNSGPVHTSPAGAVPAQAVNADFLFGTEKGMGPPHVKLRDPSAEHVVRETEMPVHGVDERMMGTDPIQKHIQDLQRLHLEEQQNMYRRKSDDNLGAPFTGGDYYVHRGPEKIAPPTVPGTVPAPVSYWQEKQVPGGVLPAVSSLGTEQPVYMIHHQAPGPGPGPAGAFHPHPHPQFVRPMAGPPGQGYYAVQRMPQETYRDQPVYNVMPSLPQAVPTVAAAPPTLQSQGPPKVAGYSEGYGVVRPATTMGVGVADSGGYTQVGYDGGVQRQMYYPPQGGVMAPPPQPQYHAMPPQAVVSSDMRTQEAAKVVPVKATQT